MKSWLVCLFVLMCPWCWAQEGLQDDTLPVVATVSELTNSDAKTVLFRTHDIRFQFYYCHLDTLDNQTCIILDSIASYLSSNKNIDMAQIGIHLSLVEWTEEYSGSLLLYMYEEIISYLVNRWVDASMLEGKQYYNYYPVCNCRTMPDEKKRECYEKSDFAQNRRVEFLIKKK